MHGRTLLKNIVITGLLFFGFLAAIRLHQALADFTAPPPVPDNPRRIVSLAPSVTETLFAIGLGGAVVGVTEYCNYPPEAKQQAMVVAGFSEVNFEAVLRQRPDLVALPLDKIRNKAFLERLGLTVMPLDTRSISGLLATVAELGAATGHQAEAAAVQSRIEKSIALARERAEGRKKPRVLFSIMHSYEGLGYITEINAVGRDGFFSQMIEIAGGENVYQGTLSFPRLSREAIIYLNPDVIIDIIPRTEDLEAVRRDWLGLGSVEAIKNNRLVFLTDEGDTVPGPRMYQTLAKLSLAFHPEPVSE